LIFSIHSSDSVNNGFSISHSIKSQIVKSILPFHPNIVIKLYELLATKSSHKFNKTFLLFESFLLNETLISFKILISHLTSVSGNTTSLLAVISTVLLLIASILSILEAKAFQLKIAVNAKKSNILNFFIIF